MAKVKVDMSGQDPKDSLGFKPIPVGIHRMKLVSLDPGYAKNPDTKKEDKNRPKLTAVLRDMDKQYGQVWYHLSFSPENYPRQKMDQFLMAIGALSDKKRKAEFDTADYINKVLEVRIVPERDRPDYTPRVLDVYPDGGGSDFDFDDGELDTEFNTKDFSMEPDEEEEDDGLFTREDLESKSAADLRTILKEDYEESTRVRDKDKLIEMILKFQAEYCEEQGISNPAEYGEDDPVVEDDDEEFEDEDEDGDEEESEYLTEEALKAMDRAELLKTAGEFDITAKGKRPSKLIEEILAAQAAPEDDEEPF